MKIESGMVGIENDLHTTIPKTYLLSQNYPNPFNATTTISFDLPESQFVTLKLYDLFGREVQTLYNRATYPGIHDIHFDASDLSSGFYFYKLQVGDYTESKSMILLK